MSLVMGKTCEGVRGYLPFFRFICQKFCLSAIFSFYLPKKFFICQNSIISAILQDSTESAPLLSRLPARIKKTEWKSTLLYHSLFILKELEFTFFEYK
jgi:hypothetical protein